MLQESANFDELYVATWVGDDIGISFRRRVLKMCSEKDFVAVLVLAYIADPSPGRYVVSSEGTFSRRASMKSRTTFSDQILSESSAILCHGVEMLDGPAGSTSAVRWTTIADRGAKARS